MTAPVRPQTKDPFRDVAPVEEIDAMVADWPLLPDDEVRRIWAVLATPAPIDSP